MYAIEINLVAVIIATVLAQAVGFLWYSPVLFGKRWMSLMGISNESKKGMGKIFVISILSSLIMSYVMAHFVILLVITTISKAVMLAIWVWAGFIATVTVHDFLWGSIKPKELYFLNNGQHLASLVVMTLALFYFL